MSVSAQALCQNDSVQISWHQASGVVNYLITVTGSLGHVDVYNTTQSLLSATVPCGQDYNVTVQAQGSKCSSIPSSPAYFETSRLLYFTPQYTFLNLFYIFWLYFCIHCPSTAPCIPSNVTTYAQCMFTMGSVSWGPSDGAKTYTAEATGLDGDTYQCLTSTTSCSWTDLHCGEQYSVVVRANNDNCSSLPSNTSIIYMSMS